MASLNEVAPTLSQYVNETQALAIADRVVDAETPAEPILIGDLGPTLRAAFFKWLQWFGASKKPSGLPAWVDYPPIKVSRLTGMSVAHIQELIAERDGIFREAARGEDAFRPDSAVPVINSVTLNGEDLVIEGVEFDSFDPHVTKVTLARGAVSITRTTAEITDAGGVVGATNITVPGSIIPGGGIQDGDTVQVHADNLASEVVTYTEVL